MKPRSAAWAKRWLLILHSLREIDNSNPKITESQKMVDAKQMVLLPTAPGCLSAWSQAVCLLQPEKRMKRFSVSCDGSGYFWCSGCLRIVSCNLSLINL